MPVTACQANGRPGFKWGDVGKCYIYIPGNERSKNRAKQKALFQGIAIGERPGVRKDAVQNEKPFVSHLRALGFTNRKFKTAKIRRRVNIIYPKGIENAYSLSLRRLVHQWKNLYLQMIDPRLESWAQEAYAQKPEGSVNVKSDAWTDELKDIMAGYQVSLTESMENLPKLTDDIAAKTSQWNQTQWQKVIRTHLGINLLTTEPWLIDQLKSFTNQNVQLVTKLAEETRADIERIISDGYQRGLRVENIRSKITSESKLTPGRFKKTRTRANLISRDQVGKLNGQLTQIRQTEADVEQYWWNTVVDERVRTSHMAMNGKLCRWDDATVYKDSPDDPEWKLRSSIGGIELHPGQDYQCRCFAEPDFSTVFEGEGI
jgi:SPP1 gp7 family putative phage head morphogenesis protein